VRADNIITHPSAPRYKSLAEAMSSLRLAEREGVGVDRMVRDMLAVGLAGPGISEMEGPWVRVSLSGGNPDLEIVQFLSSLDPAAAAEDLNVVLLLDHLCRHGFVDVETAQPVLQRSADETAAALRSAVQIKVDDSAVFDLVTGVPDGLPSAWRLSNAATARLPRCRAALSSPAARERMILEWANLRGRVSSTEVASLTGLSQVRTGQILTDLEGEGRLAPSRRSKAGRGLFYVPVPS
jgi:ATP-dependent DNA helicase RecG